jgi:hypothetical protein
VDGMNVSSSFMCNQSGVSRVPSNYRVMVHLGFHSWRRHSVFD